MVYHVNVSLIVDFSLASARRRRRHRLQRLIALDARLKCTLCCRLFFSLVALLHRRPSRITFDWVSIGLQCASPIEHICNSRLTVDCWRYMERERQKCLYL